MAVRFRPAADWATDQETQEDDNGSTTGQLSNLEAWRRFLKDRANRGTSSITPFGKEDRGHSDDEAASCVEGPVQNWPWRDDGGRLGQTVLLVRRRPLNF